MNIPNNDPHDPWTDAVTGKNSSDEKIQALAALKVVFERLRKNGKIIALCHGVFDLVHPGHIRHLQDAKRQADVLVVTITPDRYVNKGPGRPVFNERLRAESLAALQMVDFVAINEWPTAVETIRELCPNIYVKGGEYARHEDDLTGKIYDEEQAVIGVRGRIYFTDDITFSSTKLLNSFFGAQSADAEQFLRGFRIRYSAESIIGMIKALRDMRVLVVGDAIIDEYHFCQVLGRASKSAALNAKFIRAEAYAGGALAVANHIAGFCDNVHLVTGLGLTDTQEEFISTHLKPNITRQFFVRHDGPTTIKRRFIDWFLYQKMFEVTFIEDRPLPKDVAADLNSYLNAEVGRFDLVVIADFGHGLIDDDTVRTISSKAKFMAVNTQTNSANTGYNPISKYPRADYICIDQEEIRLAYHDRFGPLDALLNRACSESSASIVNVTLGNQGSTTLRPGEIVRTPVFSTEIVDTIGAGDACLSVTAPCAAAGYPPDVIGFICNAVGALAVRILGNKESVEPVALFKYISALLK